MSEYLKSLHPVTAVLQLKIADILSRYDTYIKTVLDVGGIDNKLDKLTDYEVRDANITCGIDGCNNLPFKDNSFDATVSIATLEHVKEPVKFLEECYRVAKKVTVHWFPFGDFARGAEFLKKKHGHWHPCHIPTWQEIDAMKPAFKRGETEYFTNCGEHLLLCMTLTPALKVPEVFEYVLENYSLHYGIILIGEK